MLHQSMIALLFNGSCYRYGVCTTALSQAMPGYSSWDSMGLWSGGGHLVLELFWSRTGFCCVDASYAVQLALEDREQDTTQFI